MIYCALWLITILQRAELTVVNIVYVLSSTITQHLPFGLSSCTTLLINLVPVETFCIL